MSYRGDVERERQFCEGVVEQSRDRVLHRAHETPDAFARELDDFAFHIERLALFNHTHPRERVRLSFPASHTKAAP